MKAQKGFTITELSLAMSLLSVLLFILVVSAMGFVNIYNKGITLKRVNQSGANIAKELQTNLSRSNLVTVRTITTSGGDKKPTGVCTGYFSFIWSIYPSGAGSGLGSNENPIAEADLKYDDLSTPVYFAKVRDPNKDMCRTGSSPPSPHNGACSPPSANCYESTELLGDGLVVRDPSTNSLNAGGLGITLSKDGLLTTVVYTISTNGGDDIVSDGTNRASCQGDSKSAFCALNTFVVTSYSKGVL